VSIIEDNISKRILKIADRVLRERGISRKPSSEESLAEDGIGLDSIGRLVLLAEIEKEMQIELPEEYWGSRTFENLEEIVQFILQK
jgi:acyl carrier protein